MDAGAREHVAQDIGAGQRVERIDGDHVIDAKVFDYMLAQPLDGLCAKEGAAGNHNSEDRDGALRGKPGEASGRIVRGNLGIQGEMDASLDGGLVYGAATGNLLLVAGQQGVFAAGAGGCRRVHVSRRGATGVTADHLVLASTKGFLAGDVGGAMRAARARYAAFDLMHGRHPRPGMRRRRGYTARGSRAQAQS